MKLVEPDGLSTRELLRDLLSVKLGTKARARVKLLESVWKEAGILPPEVQIELRNLFNRHRQRLTELYQARERAERTKDRKAGAGRTPTTPPDLGF